MNKSQILKLLDEQTALNKRNEAINLEIRKLLDDRPPVPIGLSGIKAVFGEPGDTRNIKPFDLPYPLKYQGKVVKRSQAHVLLIPVFKAVLSEIKAARLAGHVQNYGGIYNHRPVVGGRKASTHSWGIAIDVEPDKYPQGSTERIQAEVIAIFAKHGFIYGGDFPTPDPMHFQYAKDY
jgi:hypothetical protein